MTFALLNFLSLLLHVTQRPFLAAATNQLGTLSYSLLVALSVVLTNFDAPHDSGVQAVVALLVIPASIVFIVIVVREQWMTVQEKLNQAKASQQSIEMESIAKTAAAQPAALPSVLDPFTLDHESASSSSFTSAQV